MVTGASSGIGRAVSSMLAAAGSNLVLVARRAKELEETAALCGGKHLCVPLDLTKEPDLEELFDKAVTDGAKFSGLVHCAGMTQVLPLNMLTLQNMEKEMRLNYFAFIELVRQYARKRHNIGGSVVAVSSVAAVRPVKGQANYSASKAALNAAVNVLAQELAAKGIRVNAVLPGATDTAMIKVNGAINIKALVDQQLLGLVQPDDVAAACLFLLSGMSRMVTGRQIYVDGGQF